MACVVLASALVVGCATSTRNAPGAGGSAVSQDGQAGSGESGSGTSADGAGTVGAEQTPAEIRAGLNITEDFRDEFIHGEKPAKYQKYIVISDTEGEGATKE